VNFEKNRESGGTGRSGVRRGYRRVLLFIPSYPGSHYKYLPLQAGLGYISQMLDRNGVENSVCDMRFGYGSSDIKEKILEYRPDLIGVSMMTFRYLHTYAIISDIKDAFPSIPIVAGGPHISTLRENALRECPAIDYGVILEGEETIMELCRGEELSKIKGLIYRGDDGEVLLNQDRRFIGDLDGIHFPEYRRFEMHKCERLIPIVSSRGCPYECIYCPVQAAIGKKYRMRNSGNVVDEMEFWYEKGFRRQGFADDNFTISQPRIYEICDEIEERGMTGLRLGCSNGVRADRVDRKLLARMREVGFYELAFGVEAGNDRVLERLHKSEKIEVIRRAIEDACELGYEVTLFFLLGSPGETWSDIEDSVDLVLSYPVVSAPFYNLIPFPNTELFEWVEERGYLLKSPEEYLNDASHWENEPVFETPELPYEKRKKAWAWANRVAEGHCRKNKRRAVKAKLEGSLGIKGLPGDLFSHVWCSDLVQNRFLANRAMRKLRDRVMQRV